MEYWWFNKDKRFWDKLLSRKFHKNWNFRHPVVLKWASGFVLEGSLLRFFYLWKFCFSYLRSPNSDLISKHPQPSRLVMTEFRSKPSELEWWVVSLEGAVLFLNCCNTSSKHIRHRPMTHRLHCNMACVIHTFSLTHTYLLFLSSFRERRQPESWVPESELKRLLKFKKQVSLWFSAFETCGRASKPWCPSFRAQACSWSPNVYQHEDA